MMPDTLLPPSEEMIEIEHKRVAYREVYAAALTGILAGHPNQLHNIERAADLAMKHADAAMKRL